MSLKLEMLSGLPASGKSTYAKDKIKKDKTWGRINRDDLRQMIFNGHWTNYNEKIIIEAEKAIAEVLLKHGRNVVVDDTNISQKHEDLWHSFVNGKYDFQKTEITASLEECIARDKARQAAGLPYVGRNVIVKMAAKNGLIKWPDKDIVLVDIDGTLADGEHRVHLVKGDRGQIKAWKEYYSHLSDDKPIVPIFKWVSELAKDYTIVIVSGRGAEYEYGTIDWFEKVWEPNPLFPEQEVPRFPVFQWFFRNAGDHRPDDQVKLEVLDLLPKKPVLVIDDRPSVVRAWRSRGLKVIPVRGAIEEF